MSRLCCFKANPDGFDAMEVFGGLDQSLVLLGGHDREARTTMLGEDFRPVRPADPGGMRAGVPDEVGNGENFVHSQIEWHGR